MKDNKNNSTGGKASLKKIKKQAQATPKKNKSNSVSLFFHKNKSAIKISAIVLAVVLVLLSAATVVISVLNEAGYIIRSKVVEKNETIKLNGAMFTYYFWDMVNEELESNSGFYKLNDLADPDDINNDSPYGKTWKEYFFSIAKEELNAMMNYAIYAEEHGYEPTPEDLELIDDEIAELNRQAAVQGRSLKEYLAFNYGRGVSEQDVRDTLYIILMYNISHEKLLESIKVSDDEIEKHKEDNIENLMCSDYLFFTVGETGKVDLSEAKKELYLGYAERLKNAPDEAEYKKIVREYLEYINTTYPLGSEERLDGEELEGYIENELELVVYEKFKKSASNKIDNWIFSEERESGDTFINHEEGYGSYGVVFMLKPSYIDPDWKEICENRIISERMESILIEIDERYSADLSIFENSIAMPR